MTKHLSELNVGHAYAPIDEGKDSFAQQIDQLLSWLQSMNADLSSLLLSAILVVSIYAISFYILTTKEDGRRLTAAKKALPTG